MQSMKALEVWRELYRQTQHKIACTKGAAQWQFDEVDVFAQTNAFINRCRSAAGALLATHGL